MAKPVVAARGMRDVLPADKLRRDRVAQIIRDTYRANGFSEIETPAIEPLSRLLSDQGGENEKMIFEILRRGLPRDEEVAVRDASDLGLRYDLTVPLTRFYASHAAELPRVFRALQTGPVWRAERPQKGRFRQFVQFDIDIIGDPSTVAEVDLVTTTLQAFAALGMAADIEVLINDRRILLDLLNACGIAPENQDAALIALDKADKIGAAGVRAELLAKGLADEAGADRLLRVTADLAERADEVLAAGEISLAPGDDLAAAGTPAPADTPDAPATPAPTATPAPQTLTLYDLPGIVSAVRELVPGARIRFDATLVRGMGYYTGPIFEVAHKELGYSVAGGGRYDRVVGKWLGRDVPACGFSIGFERIADLVQLPPTDDERVAVLYKPGQDPASLLAVRGALSDAGYTTGLVVPPRRPGAQFFDELSDSGYTHTLDARRGDASIADLRELRS